MEALLGAAAVLIRPEAGGEYDEWLACLRSVGMKGAAMAKMRKSVSPADVKKFERFREQQKANKG